MANRRACLGRTREKTLKGKRENVLNFRNTFPFSFSRSSIGRGSSLAVVFDVFAPFLRVCSLRSSPRHRERTLGARLKSPRHASRVAGQRKQALPSRVLCFFFESIGRRNDNGRLFFVFHPQNYLPLKNAASSLAPPDPPLRRSRRHLAPASPPAHQARDQLPGGHRLGRDLPGAMVRDQIPSPGRRLLPRRRADERRGGGQVAAAGGVRGAIEGRRRRDGGDPGTARRPAVLASSQVAGGLEAAGSVGRLLEGREALDAQRRRGEDRGDERRGGGRCRGRRGALPFLLLPVCSSGSDCRRSSSGRARRDSRGAPPLPRSPGPVFFPLPSPIRLRLSLAAATAPRCDDATAAPQLQLQGFSPSRPSAERAQAAGVGGEGRVEGRARRRGRARRGALSGRRRRWRFRRGDCGSSRRCCCEGWVARPAQRHDPDRRGRRHRQKSSGRRRRRHRSGKRFSSSSSSSSGGGGDSSSGRYKRRRPLPNVLPCPLRLLPPSQRL